MPCAWIPLLLALQTPHPADQAADVFLFDGKDLSGWTGDHAFWSVEDGCLVGRSTAEHPLPRSVYLFSDQEADDFELEFEYRIVGGNSGVQYRSERLPDGEVAGYQADIEDGPNYSGILYESAGRAILASRGQRVQILADGTRLSGQELGDAMQLQAAIHVHDWNHYRILAKGAHLIHEINGVRMVEVVDEDAALARARGRFALQLHQGPPMEVRFRDIRLRRLGPQDFVEVESLPAAQESTSDPERPEWIWSAQPQGEHEKQWFLHSFLLEEPATLSSGRITCDNGFTAWIDGTEIADGTQWWAPSSVTPGLQLAPGSHSLAITAWNEGGPAGLAAHLEFTGQDGKTIPVATGKEWRSTAVAPETWPAMDLETLSPTTWQPVRSLGVVGAPGLVWGRVMAPPIATPVDHFVLPDGFEATLVHTATATEGSWASMTFGDAGEIYVSPERGPLLRIRFPHGYEESPTVQPLDTPVHSAQGLLYAYDALYANVAGGIGEQGDGGLHRLRDRDGDGTFEDHAHLAKYGPPSEHGAHGIVLGPDGLLYTVLGNHTKLPENLAPNSPFRDFAEDVLLPRLWDPRGHAHGMFAPAAVVLRTDKDATSWELVAGGMRNPYDLAFSPEGELFTYDSDMEWDIGMPWYRSPRVVQVLLGGESGWRSGSAKWPADYPDALPAVLETGPASPVGITFGTKSHFPEEWRNRLFLADWAYGRITAVDLAPRGAGWEGSASAFLSGKPLNVTDLEFGPDGALWFTTGGRGTQSGLYRVYSTGAGGETGKAFANPSEAVLLRKKLGQQKTTLEETLEQLGSQDPVLRFAARGNLERRPAEEWQGFLHTWEPSLALGELLLAATRVGETDMRRVVRARLLDWDFGSAPPAIRWQLLRTAMLLRTRSGQGETTSPDAEMAAYFGKHFPTLDAALDREIARLLVAVDAPNLPATLLPKMLEGSFQEEQLHYALLLRLVSADWEEEQQLAYLTWLRSAHAFAGGMSLAGFLLAMEEDALASLADLQRQDLLARLPAPRTNAPALRIPQRAFRREWSVADALRVLEDVGSTTAGSESWRRGEDLFRTLSCLQCHRWDGDGGSLGPDLSAVGRRFGRHDLLEALIEPEKAVSDQFKMVPMPPGLLNTTDAEELADLIRFLEAGPQPARR